MEIKLSKEEIDFIVQKLSAVQLGLVYDVVKLLEKKTIEASQAQEAERREGES